MSSKKRVSNPPSRLVCATTPLSAMQAKAIKATDEAEALATAAAKRVAAAKEKKAAAEAKAAKKRALTPEPEPVVASDDEATSKPATPMKLDMKVGKSPTKTVDEVKKLAKKAKDLTAADMKAMFSQAIAEMQASNANQEPEESQDPASFEREAEDSTKALADLVAAQGTLAAEATTTSDSPILTAMASTSLAVQSLVVEGQMGSFRQIDAALALLSALSGTIDGLDTSGKTVPAKDVKLAKREMSTLVYTQLGVLQALGSAMDETFGGIGHVLQAEVLARSQAAKANNANYLARTLHITGTSGSLSAPILAVMQQNAHLNAKADPDSGAHTSFWRGTGPREPRANTSSKTKAPLGGGTCYNCGKPGHYASNCKSKKMTRGRSRSRSPRRSRSRSKSRSRSRSRSPRSSSKSRKGGK